MSEAKGYHKRIICVFVGLVLGVGLTVSFARLNSPPQLSDQSFSVGDHVFVFVPSPETRKGSAYKWGFRTGVGCQIANSQPSIDAHPWVEPQKSWWDEGFEDGTKLAETLTVDRHVATEELVDHLEHVLMIRHSLSEHRTRVEKTIQQKELLPDLVREFDQEIDAIDVVLDDVTRRIGEVIQPIGRR